MTYPRPVGGPVRSCPDPEPPAPWSGGARIGVELGPVVLALIAGCLIVVTASTLGVAWLSQTFIGLPAGLWIVGAGAGAAWWRTGRARVRELHVSSVGAGLVPWLLDRAGNLGAGFECAWRALRLWRAFDSSDLSSTAAPALCRLHDRSPWPTRPARVGVGVADADLARLLAARVGEDCEVRIGEAGADAVIVRERRGSVCVRTPELTGREAAWYDWAAPRPIVFASVFPYRIDCQRVTLRPREGEGTPSLFDERAFGAELVRAAAWLSRSPGRIALADRLRGRRPVPNTGSNGPDEGAGRAAAAMLAGAVRLRDADSADPTARVMARLASAWIVLPWTEIDRATRRDIAESCAVLLPGEADVALRVAAVRFADFDDDGGIEALRRADVLLRHAAPVLEADHAAFVQSEIEHGAGTALALGRVAAGMCLAAAGTPYRALEPMLDDLLDDLRFSGWLVGHDQDIALLTRVVRDLVRVRTSEDRGLPPRRAA